jgi:hypothetical protein
VNAVPLNTVQEFLIFRSQIQSLVRTYEDLMSSHKGDSDRQRFIMGHIQAYQTVMVMIDHLLRQLDTERASTDGSGH